MEPFKILLSCPGTFLIAGDHRQPKLTMWGVIIFLYFRKHSVKCDVFTEDVYYITTKFGYAKRDLCLAAEESFFAEENQKAITHLIGFILSW